MRDLCAKVDRTLAEVSDATATPARKGRHRDLAEPSTSVGISIVSRALFPETIPATSAAADKELPDLPAEEEVDDSPAGPVRGHIGSIRPCGVVAGAPSRWTFPDKRTFEIEAGKNPTRIEKFIAALRALVKDMRRRGGGMRTVNLEHGEAVALDGRERGYRFPYDGDAELFEGAKVTRQSDL
jgi:hypothetical protein